MGRISVCVKERERVKRDRLCVFVKERECVYVHMCV
jgi:hypothetical protein